VLKAAEKTQDAFRKQDHGEDEAQNVPPSENADGDPPHVRDDDRNGQQEVESDRKSNMRPGPVAAVEFEGRLQIARQETPQGSENVCPVR